MNKVKITCLVASLAVVALPGCTTLKTEGGHGGSQSSDELSQLRAELDAKQGAIAEKDQLIQSYRDRLSQSPAAQNAGDDLLPPGAKPGECYARVWVPPKYRTITKEVLVKEADEKVSVTPAKYTWAEEQVLVKEASSRVETIPAVYGTETDRILVKEAERVWKTDLGRNAIPANDRLLATARAHGIDLDAAQPGMCYHEHYRPAEYATESTQIEVSPASVKVAATPAQYRYVEKRILVADASYKVRNIPAEYGWEEEKVVDKPAHTVWKKGTGPIQKIDEATGEIMCLVEVPATYKTIRKRVLKAPARTERVEVPAQYKTVKVRELTAPAGEVKTEVPAQYKTVNVTKQVSGPTFVWHEVHNMEEPASTRTGAKICLTEQPAQYKTVTRKVVKTPATSRTIDIPAEYKTVKVRKLATEPQEVRTPVPAEYKTVTTKELEADGHMQWRSILCETNMTVSRISSIQQALQTAGYNPGRIDGVIGKDTMRAINAFQRDKSLPVDKYINLDTLKALGVSPR